MGVAKITDHHNLQRVMGEGLQHHRGGHFIKDQMSNNECCSLQERSRRNEARSFSRSEENLQIDEDPSFIIGFMLESSCEQMQIY